MDLVAFSLFFVQMLHYGKEVPGFPFWWNQIAVFSHLLGVLVFFWWSWIEIDLHESCPNGVL